MRQRNSKKEESRNNVPRNWPDFLQDSVNKQELFALTLGQHSINQVCRGQTNLCYLRYCCDCDCDHEEADTRMLVHLQDALDTGTCWVHTVNTDMVIIIIGKFHALTVNHLAADIWIVFGTAMPWEKPYPSDFSRLYLYCDTLYSFMGERDEFSMGSMESIPRGN